MAVSRDGSQLAYTTDKGLYLRAISSATSRLVAGTDQGVTAEPAFSPDGQSIAFVSLTDRQLKVIPVAGGTATPLCPIELPATVSWTTDSIVFGQPTGVMRVSPNGGPPEQLVRVKPGEGALSPQLLADGQTVLFTLSAGVDGDRWPIVAQSLKTGSRQTLVQGGSNLRVVRTGHLLYVTAGVLFAVPFDQAAVRVTGKPVPVLEGVARGAPVSAQYAVSDSGSLVYLPGPALPSSRLGRLAMIDEKGSVVPLSPSVAAYAWPRIAPDGRQIAYGVQEAQGFNIWIYDLDGRSAARRLTFGGNNRFPAWSPDSRHLVFQSDRGGDLALYRQPADVTGESAERITRPEAGTSHVPESWSRQEDILSVSVVHGATTLSTLSMRDRKMMPFGTVRSTNLLNSEFSPDGHWIAYTVRGGASVTMINVEPFPATGAKSQISKPDELAHHALWAPDGKSLFYVPGNQPVVGVSITTRPSFAFGNPITAPGNVPNTNPFGEPRNFDIAPDGRRWVAVVDPTAPGSTQASGATLQMQVVLNWFEELTQRVPVK
jgi:Tol biopolymer transport system component